MCFFRKRNDTEVDLLAACWMMLKLLDYVSCIRSRVISLMVVSVAIVHRIKAKMIIQKGGLANTGNILYIYIYLNMVIIYKQYHISMYIHIYHIYIYICIYLLNYIYIYKYAYLYIYIYMNIICIHRRIFVVGH